MVQRSYTNEQLAEAIKTSLSIREALIKLQLYPAGANHTKVTNLIEKLNLDISHFCYKPHQNKPMPYFSRPIGDYLSNKFTIQTSRLKKRLLREKIFEYVCQNCYLKEWLGNPIPLELHHIDGNPENNNLNNLQLLCPNCHSLTPNFRGHNKKTNRIKKIQKTKNEPQPKCCCDCGKNILRKSDRCKSCAAFLSNEKYLKINWLPTAELIAMVNESSYLAVARKLGVSDNAIRKRIRNHPND